MLAAAGLPGLPGPIGEVGNTTIKIGNVIHIFIGIECETHLASVLKIIPTSNFFKLNGKISSCHNRIITAAIT